MKLSKEVEFCKNVFLLLGKKKSEDLLERSNLNNREKIIINSHLLQGLSLKECASILLIEEDSVNKAQKKALNKLYEWIKNQTIIEQILYA